MPVAPRLTLHPGLFDASRLRRFASDGATASWRDWLILGSAGIGAACASTFLKIPIRVPGHAILCVVFPMSCGLALAPRHGAGVVMGATGVLTAMALRLMGFGGDGFSLGALTSLAATGPLLDWTLRRSRDGWRLYGQFALAGLASNTLAFAVRGGAKAMGWEHVGGRPLAAWLSQAVFTYALCGLLAGLFSGVVLFYARKRRAPA